MEWRIIVPLLCLIGILHVPGNAAQTSTNGTSSTFNITFYINLQFKDIYSNMSNNETIQLKQSISSEVVPVYSGLKNFQSFEILAFSNGSIVVDGKLNFNSSDTKPLVANLTQLLHDRNFTFTLNKTLTKITEVTPTSGTVTNTTSTNSTTNTTASTPTKLAKFNVVFKMNQTFNETYSNLTHPDTVQLTNKIVNTVSPFYRKKFPLFFAMLIQRYSPGSIVVDSVVQFDTSNSTSPNLTEVKNTLVDAVTNGNLSLQIDAASINVTDVSSNDTTTTAAPATTSASSVVAEYNITFKLRDTFTSELANISSPTSKALEKNISDQCGVAYKYLRGFIRALVRKFSNGSVLVDGALQFNKTISSPSVTDLAKILADNVRNGTVTLQIDPTTIKVTDASGNTANKSAVLASMLTAFWMTLASLLLSAVMH